MTINQIFDGLKMNTMNFFKLRLPVMATVNGFNAFNHSWDFHGKTHSNKFRRFGIHEKEKYG